METGRTLIVVLLALLALGVASSEVGGEIDEQQRPCASDSDCIFCTSDDSQTYTQYTCTEGACVPPLNELTLQ